MADAELAAELAAIKERNEALRSRYGYVGGLLVLAKAQHDVPRLVKAVEAVLQAAAGWQRFAAEDDAQDECAREVRKIIARELTGTEADHV